MSSSPAARTFSKTMAGSLLAPLALGACVVRVDSHDYRVRDEKRFTVDGVPEIHLTTFDGAVDVRGWDRDEVVVEIEKRGREKEAVEQIDVVTEQKGNSVSVDARQPTAKKYAFGMLTTRSQSAHLIASVPTGSHVTVHTGDGKITIERVKGRIELKTSDGNIVGLDLIGDVLARTDDGSVRMTSVDGKCDVVSGDGSIALDGRFDLVRARTGDGTVTVKVMPGSHVTDAWSVVTGDGNAILYLPDGFNAELDAETGDGQTRIEKELRIHIEGEVAKRMLRGTLGTGGSMFRVRTSDGHIVLKRLPFNLRLPDAEQVEKIEK